MGQDLGVRADVRTGGGGDELGQRLGEGEERVAGGRGCAGVERVTVCDATPIAGDAGVVDAEADAQALAVGDGEVIAPRSGTTALPRQRAIGIDDRRPCGGPSPVACDDGDLARDRRIARRCLPRMLHRTAPPSVNAVSGLVNQSTTVPPAVSVTWMGAVQPAAVLVTSVATPAPRLVHASRSTPPC